MKHIFTAVFCSLLTSCAVTTDLDLRKDGGQTQLASELPTEAVYRHLTTNFRECFARIQVVSDFYPDVRQGSITVKVDHGNNITNLALVTVRIEPNKSGGTTVTYWQAKDKNDWDIPKQISAWANGKPHKCLYDAFYK